MAFESLANRIDNLPLIICGPIVRHCHDKGITVWVSLRKPVESVTLSVFNDGNGLPNEIVAFDIESTLEFGKHLHIVTITAAPMEESKPLEWGKSYLYDMAFDANKQGGFGSLKDEGVLGSIDQVTYQDYSLPAIKLPPKSVSKLRFIQGSCRNNKGKGLDAMQALDDILGRDWKSSKRPQQLFLTGDQIYADEVDDILLFILTDAARVLLSGTKDGWQEQLPDVNQIPSDLGPATRYETVRESAKFTTSSGGSHLLSLGEYFAMYLFVWSDTLWQNIPEPFPLEDLPNAEQVYENFFKNEEIRLNDELKKAIKEVKQNIADAKKRDERIAELELAKDEDFEAIKIKRKLELNKKKKELRQFQQAIPKIRKGMANIATYMTFDDHEVTDDWHLNRDWVEEVYQTGIGRRIMTNALAAFAVFQASGNTPERFIESVEDGKPRGRRLLETISQWIKTECKSNDQSVKDIAKLVNIPVTDKEVDKLIDTARGGKIRVSEDSVKWYFTFKHPKYEAIFTDARTERALPDKRYRPSEHLTDASIVDQIELTKTNPEFTLLVSPCNLVTINYFRNWVAKYGLPVRPFVQNQLERHNMFANNPDLADSWVPQTKAYENIISRLATRVPIKDGKRKSRLVVLSGDVHFSAIMRMQYWADKPFRIFKGDPIQEAKANRPKDSPAEFVMAHMVCSALRNELNLFKLLHIFGYEIDDMLDRKEKLPFPEIYFGYPGKDDLSEAKTNEILLNTRWFPNFRPSMIRQEPVMIPVHQRDANIDFPVPEWYYRFDAIRGEKLSETQANSAPEKDPSGFFGKVSHHFYYSKDKVPGLEMISTNSIAEFDFQWGGEAKLTQAMSLTDKSFDAEVIKDFPKPPFQVIIDEEVIEVLELETIPPIGKFQKIRRKFDQTKASEHAIGTTVKIRKAVVQIHWVVEPGKEDQELIEKGLKLIKQESKMLTRFVIPMEFEDPKYEEPETSTQSSSQKVVNS